jgi:anaphase-promoting complex subunit 6
MSAKKGGGNPQPLSQVDLLRNWRHDALMQHHYATAENLGDKILALTNDATDAFWLAQVYYDSGNYARASQLLIDRREIDKSVLCQYLAAKALTAMEKWDEALEIVGDRSTTVPAPAGVGEDKMTGIKIQASIAYLRGLIYAHQSNYDLAKECYREAVQTDPKCYEAFDQLVRNSLLTPAEEKKLIHSLDFQTACGEAGELIRSLYTIRLNKYDNLDAQQEAQQILEDVGLTENSEVLLSRADQAYVQCRFDECLALCERILKVDKHKVAVLPNYVSCLYELGATNKLFRIAHDLADTHPQEPAAWLAVGTYYLSVNRVSEARMYFSKASMMHPYFGPAWIGFAHTFALEGEHEQAIHAYSTCVRLFPGSHLPTLFLGMQHLCLMNFTLAEEYFMTSYSLCITDPLLLNELGVVYYHKNQLKAAESYFVRAKEAADGLDSDAKAWMSIDVNLAHVYRRMEEYSKSLYYFENVLRLSPNDSNILSAIGLVNLQTGKILRAIENFHDALSINKDDTIASDFLERALQNHAYTSDIFANTTEPDFNVPELGDLISASSPLLFEDDDSMDLEND